MYIPMVAVGVFSLLVPVSNRLYHVTPVMEVDISNLLPALDPSFVHRHHGSSVVEGGCSVSSASH